MWSTQKIEDVTEARLSEERGKELFSLYVSARKALVEEVLPQIKAELPSHSDHGSEHIANVLSNVGKLLDTDGTKSGLTGLDLYCLILSILFHDSGNIFGRRDHQKKISKIYDFACPEPSRDKQEKLAVLKVTEAH